MSRRSRVSPFALSESLAPRVPRVTPEEFVRAWQQAPSLQDLARSLNMREGTATERARIYRLRGVPLKFFAPRVNVRALIALARSL